MRSLSTILWLLVACSNKEAPPAPAPTPAPAPPAPPAPTAPPAAPAPSGAAGTWITDGGKTKLVLEPGGTFVMDTKKGQHVTGTYVLDGDKLTMKGGGEGAISGTFSGTLEGSTLELQFGPKTSTFERQP